MESSVLIANVGYLVSIILFILGIKRMGKIKTARSANGLAAVAMLLALASGLIELGNVNYQYIIAGMLIGTVLGSTVALKVKMTEMPQMVGLLHSFCGLSSLLIGVALFMNANSRGDIATLAQLEMHHTSGIGTAIELVLSIFISAITFTGSIVAFLKLAELVTGKPILLPARHAINVGILLGILALSIAWIGFVSDPATSLQIAIAITVLSLVVGALLVIPIGGADMPVVISLLNGYSGMATCVTGFVLGSNVLIVTGAIVGSTGIVLTKIMCKAMNRSLANVMFGGFGAVDEAGSKESGYNNVKSAEAEEAAMDFEDAQNVIIVPGYGLAVAQGQNAVREFADQLKSRGCRVRYAIHPVAGRMPGHMNVLLAESNVPYDELFEMDEINSDFQSTDIALIVGANDVVNPAAKEDKASPLYGMPVLNVEEARQVFVIKRSLGAGFAGVKNVLFEKENCRMIYGDAKKVLEELATELSESHN